MKKIPYYFLVLVIALMFSTSVFADPGDTYVQVNFDIPGPNNGQCSVLKVSPDGDLTEFASFESITALTGNPNCDFDDTGITIADNGDVYFSEDDSDSIILSTPEGMLSTFISESEIIAVTGDTSADLDNALDIGPDGNLYFIDEESDTVLMATIPGAEISIVLTPGEIQAVTGTTDVDLDAGIAFDCDGNLYFVNNPEDAELDDILRLTPSGNLSIFVSGLEIIDGTGFASDIDSGVAFFDSLFILDEGQCDCVIKVDLDKDISVFLTEAQITSVTGNGGANPDGGIAVRQNREVIYGDDGSSPEDPNLLVSNPIGTDLQILVSTAQLEDFYDFVPFSQIDLQGSIVIEGVDPCLTRNVPTFSQWGLIMLAAMLGIVGYIVVRRKNAVA
ncbi:MAG: IPTL-CTERM sorting domain-containing protein [Thermodesulfobacteriota bacterium]